MQRDLIISVLCCPDCHGELTLYPELITSGDVKTGAFFCKKCKDIVGRIDDYKYDFIHFDRKTDIKSNRRKLKKGELPVRKNDKPAQIVLMPGHDYIGYIGDWQIIDEIYKCSPGITGKDKIRIMADCINFQITFLCHPWSGKVKILVDGYQEFVFDLFHNGNSTRKTFGGFPDMPYGPHNIEIIPLCEKNEKTSANQVIFHSCTLYTDGKVVNKYIHHIENRGNPYPPGFLKLLKEVPKDGYILDCGGGDRQFDDDRYINFEYLKFELPDIFGDGHKLPFKSNTFDLVLSQAVIEHMADPFQAARELFRVTKPGGLLWAESAFMQPLHAAPYHYFNTTIWGIEQLLRQFKKKESGWFGDLSFTFDWMIRNTSIIKHLGEEKYKELYETFKELDQYVTYDEKRNISSGVYFMGRKEI